MATLPDLVWANLATTGTAATLALGAAVNGYRLPPASFSGQDMPYKITDGSAWETGHGVWTYAGGSWSVARTMRESSSGSMLSLSTSATIMVEVGGVDLAALAAPPPIPLTANTTLVAGQTYEGRASGLNLTLPLSTGYGGAPISFVGTFGDEATNPVTIALTGSDTITAGSPPQTDTSATYKQTNLPLVFYQRVGGWNAF